MSSMKDIRLEKVTLNIGTGKPGPELEKAVKLLSRITGRKPVETVTQKRIPTWGIRPGLKIGCKVTLRGKEADAMLKRLFAAVDNKINGRKIDQNGNLSFGIKEYLDIPGAEYDISIGIIGLNAAITLMKPGFRVKNRRLKERTVGIKQRITSEESKLFFQNKYGITFEEQ